MTCPEFRDRVEDVLDELLPPEEAARYLAHRDACAECAEQWDEAERFRALLAREGRAALGAWEARRLSVRAATLVPDEGTPAPIVRPRFGLVRLTAAAAVIAAAAFVGSGLLGDPGPVRLAYGDEMRLDPGTQATFGHDCSLIVEDRAVTLTLERGPDSKDGASDVLHMDRGVALFRVHPEHALGVATPQGVAHAVGATFVVDVRSDGAVSVDVVTGRVRLERGEGLVVARPGERVEVDSGGVAHVVSRARLDDLELENDRRSEEIEALRADVAHAEQQLEAYVRAAPQGTPGADPGGALPFDELGRVMRTLTDRSIGFRDARRNEAMAFFLLNAERIRTEFGISDPIRAMETPGFVAAIADSFFAALAPEASDSAVAATAADVREICVRLDADSVGDPLPTELAAARQRALVEIIRSVERRLGVVAAVEIVRSFRGAWDGPRPWVHPLDDRTEARMVGFRQKHLSLDDEQTSRVAELVRAYVAQTVAMQERVAATLPAEEVDSVMFPRRGFGPGGFGGSRRGGASRGGGVGNGDGDGDGDGNGGETAARPERPEPSDSEIVSARLREIDARLHLAEPRARFERALWNLLAPEQREKEFGRGPQLLTFREKQGD